LECCLVDDRYFPFSKFYPDVAFDPGECIILANRHQDVICFDPFSPEAEMLRRQLTELMRDEVDRAFAEQEALAATA
jgi:hypothetical protein